MGTGSPQRDFASLFAGVSSKLNDRNCVNMLA